MKTVTAKIGGTKLNILLSNPELLYIKESHLLCPMDPFGENLNNGIL